MFNLDVVLSSYCLSNAPKQYLLCTYYSFYRHCYKNIGGNVATCKHLEFARLQAPKICMFKFVLSITINGDNDQWERNNMKEYSVNVSMKQRLGLHSVEDRR
ncbi:hypothetical protein AHAS_Ahas13G0370300 [Arachis hypogaea]